MIGITVTARLESMAHLGERNTGGAFLAGLGHIPGRALLGAAAWAFLDRGGNPQGDEFAERFLSGAVSWGDLLPITEETALRDAAALPQWVPRTTYCCKLFRLQHPLVDVLLQPKEAVRCAGSVAAAGEALRCCEVGIDRLVERSLTWDETYQTWRQAEVQREHRTHLSIDPHLQTARATLLYSREVLRRGQWFRGQLRCADERVADTVMEALEQDPLAVGGARSRGYGQIRVQATRGPLPGVTEEELAARSEQIRAALALPATGICFVLGAASDWALRRGDGAYATALDPARLRELLGLPGAAVEICRSDWRSEVCTPWDGKTGMPLLVRRVLRPGSTWLCRVTGVELSGLHRRLQEVVAQGLGAHRVEGLGQVTINHSLHFTTRGERSHG